MKKETVRKILDYGKDVPPPCVHNWKDAAILWFVVFFAATTAMALCSAAASLGQGRFVVYSMFQI